MFDIPFLVGVFALLFVGLAMLFSAGYADALNRYGDSYHYIKSQLFAVLVGLVAMLVASFVSYKFYRRFVWLFYGICIALLIAVLLVFHIPYENYYQGGSLRRSQKFPSSWFLPIISRGTATI